MKIRLNKNRGRRGWVQFLIPLIQGLASSGEGAAGGGVAGAVGGATAPPKPPGQPEGGGGGGFLSGLSKAMGGPAKTNLGQSPGIASLAQGNFGFQDLISAGQQIDDFQKRNPPPELIQNRDLMQKMLRA